MSDITLTIAGEQIYLLPERAIFWPGASTLVVADLHWGKASTFRAVGIPIPIGTTSDDLARLDSALQRTHARRMVVLGDLFHAKAGRVASHTLAVLRHEPVNSTDGYGLAGHVHPGLTLVGRGLQRETLPCFIIGRNAALLPAFG